MVSEKVGAVAKIGRPYLYVVDVEWFVSAQTVSEFQFIVGDRSPEMMLCMKIHIQRRNKRSL